MLKNYIQFTNNCLKIVNTTLEFQSLASTINLINKVYSL